MWGKNKQQNNQAQVTEQIEESVLSGSRNRSDYINDCIRLSDSICYGCSLSGLN